MAPAMKKADLAKEFGKGFYRVPEIFESACEHGIIQKDENSYIIKREVFNDKHQVEQYLIENTEVLNKIIMILRKHLLEMH